MLISLKRFSFSLRKSHHCSYYVVVWCSLNFKVSLFMGNSYATKVLININLWSIKLWTFILISAKMFEQSTKKIDTKIKNLKSTLIWVVIIHCRNSHTNLCIKTKQPYNASCIITTNVNSQIHIMITALYGSKH